MIRHLARLPLPVRLAALLCLMCAPLAPAHGQIGDSSQPLDTTAERIENRDSEGKTVLIGSVDITQGDRRLMADRVELLWTQTAAGERGDIERVIATGNVRYFSPTQNASGDRGVYELATETITLTGEVVITQGENVITTTHFVSNLATNDSSFGEPGSGDRVRAVIFPQSNSEEDGDGEAGGR